MNALFGVLGTPACRFFDPAIANAITGFGQQTLHWTRRGLRRGGRARALRRHRLGVRAARRRRRRRQSRSGAARARRGGDRRAHRARVRRRVAPRARARARLRALLPAARARRRAAAARSATRAGSARAAASSWWSGLESVRRDWPAVARRLQQGMLERVFQDREVLPFVREVVARVRAGELDAELVYASASARARLERYTAALAAARAGRAQGGTQRRRRDPLRDHRGRPRARAAAPPAAAGHRPAPLRRARAAPARRRDARAISAPASTRRSARRPSSRCSRLSA